MSLFDKEGAVEMKWRQPVIALGCGFSLYSRVIALPVHHFYHSIVYCQYLVLNILIFKKGKKPHNHPAKKRSALTIYIALKLSNLEV
jgi:hypothetical protein